MNCDSLMFDIEFERFTAEAGCGIPELRLRPPRVYTRPSVIKFENQHLFYEPKMINTYFSWLAHTEEPGVSVLRHYGSFKLCVDM